MASVLLTAGGAALGAAIPGVGLLAGPLLGLAGSYVGGAIDSALGLSPRATGARMASLKVQDSREGAPIPRLYGTMRVAGNVIWASDLIETRRSTKISGGKGGSASATTYQYKVHLAVGLCAGPIAGLQRVWADSKLIYDVSLNTIYAGALRFYNGSSTQTADAFLQAALGASNTPAYRGIAYVVIENLNLDHFGNRIPNLTFEVEGISGGFNPVTLAQTAHTAGPWGGSENARRAIVTGPNCLLVMGKTLDTAATRFIAEHYTFTNGTLTRTARSVSNALTVTGSENYAVSPDGRYVACINADNGSNGELALYKISTQTFSTITVPTLNSSDNYAAVTVAWLDNTNIIVSAGSGGFPAVLSFKRAGDRIVNAGIPPATVLYTNGIIGTFWERVEPAWVMGALTLFLHDGTYSQLAVARLQMQNGALRVAALPAVSLGAGYYKIMALPDDSILVAKIASNVELRTYAITTSGLSLTRAATTLAVTSTGIEDMMALPGDRLALLCTDTGFYAVAEVTLTATSFTLTGSATTASGSPAATGSLATLRRFSGNLAAVLRDNLLLVVAPRRGDNTLTGIITDLCSAINVATPDTSAAGTARVPGFAITDVATVRDALETLQDAYPFTLIESDGTLKATAFTSATPVTVNTAVRRASADETQPPSVSYSRTQAQELPTAVQVDYLDSTQDYNSASRLAARLAPPYTLLTRLNLPMALDSTSAQQIAETRLARALAEQSRIKISVSRALLALDSGDIITVDGTTYRITSLTERGGVIDIEAVRQITGTLSATPTLVLANTNAPQTEEPPQLLVLDLPPLTNAEDQPGVYLAATASAGWRGGVVYRSVNGETPTEYARLGAIASTGVATTTLATGPSETFDNRNSVTVAMTYGTLTSATELAVLNGANVALLGSEIIQFKTATLVSDSTYVLSGLLRGRRGTESALATHAAGENFILLDSTALVFVPAPLTARNQTVSLQLVTTGQTISDSLPFDISYAFRTIQPFTPAQVRATRDQTTGDIAFTWVRRARVNADWVDYTDVPLDDTIESYVLEVTDGFGTVLRSFAPTTSTQLYTSAQQTTDFGSLPGTVTCRVAQISQRYGRGATLETTITL